MHSTNLENPDDLPSKIGCARVTQCIMARAREAPIANVKSRPIACARSCTCARAQVRRITECNHRLRHQTEGTDPLGFQILSASKFPGEQWPDIDKNFHSKLSILLRKCCFVEPSSNVKQKMTPLWQLVDLLRLVSLPISDGRASSCIDSPSPSWSWQLSKWQVGGEMHLICDSRARAG